MGLSRFKAIAEDYKDRGLLTAGGSDSSGDRSNHDLIRKRVAVQSFIHANDQLIRLFLSDDADLARAHPDPRMRSLEAASRYSLELAEKAAMASTGKKTATSAEARLFRALIGGQIVHHIRSGKALDEERLVATLRETAAIADPRMDTSPFRDFNVDERANWLLTLNSVMARLMRSVDKYSFRRPAAEVARELSMVVLERAVEAAEALLDRDDLDVRNRTRLMQSFSRSLSGFMTAVYEDVTREALRKLLPLDEERRQAWLADADCVKIISQRFLEKADSFIEILKDHYDEDYIRAVKGREKQEKGESSPEEDAQEPAPMAC